MNYKNVKIAKGARIAKQSVILGNVTIGRDSCVLYYAVIRGDDAPVVIGEETNIQENCTIHVSHNMPVHIGNNVTVGHNAVIHGCTIGDRTLIGMGAVILDGEKIGNDCIIGAGWFSGNGQSGQDQTKPYLGREAWYRGKQQRISCCVRRDESAGCIIKK